MRALDAMRACGYVDSTLAKALEKDDGRASGRASIAMLLAAMRSHLKIAA